MAQRFASGLLLCISFLWQPEILAQQVSLVLRGGLSSYGSVSIGNIGGGGGDHNWKTGPIVGTGIRIRTSEAFALEALVEYSTHQYQSEAWEEPPTNDPRNRILDLNGVGRFGFVLFDPLRASIFGGIGLSYQDKDEVIIATAESQRTAPGRSAVDVGAILGIGLAVQLSSKLELSVDGSWRMRYYVTPVALLGIAYSLS
jgi:hypothetical protein